MASHPGALGTTIRGPEAPSGTPSARRFRPTAVTVLGLLLGTLFTGAAVSPASEVPLTGAQGHPRDRFPLAVHLETAGDARLDAAARRAVEDWNTVAREVLGVTAFLEVQEPGQAQVFVTWAPRAGSLMGIARMSVDASDVIELPVRITMYPAAPRGETPADLLVYQVLAHELGHALGLPHTRDPRSLMCCVPRSIDFNDPPTREAYVAARRNPDIGSVRTELVDHYAGFWRRVSRAGAPGS